MRTLVLSPPTILLTTSLLAGCLVAAQLPLGGPPPPARNHTVTESSELKTVPATKPARGVSRIWIDVKGDYRVIRANGVPDHATGEFPNKGNPHRISKQSNSYRIPLKPEIAEEITPLRMGSFGIAVNGIPFDPSAAEWYHGDRRSPWQYEPLSGAIAMGLDASHAHVQPNGAYHYHGLPTYLLSTVKLDPTGHSPIIGWAADGFPIYAVYGYSDSNDRQTEVTALKSSYRLRKGERPGGREPDGEYDGTFIADYIYEEGLGDLDECNGRVCVTPDFPEGTYAYFLTEDWPVIPRYFRGTPSKDFRKRPRPAKKGKQQGGQLIFPDSGGNGLGQGTGFTPGSGSRPPGRGGGRPR